MSQEEATILPFLCLPKIRDCSTYVAIPKYRKPLIYEISTSFYHDASCTWLRHFSFLVRYRPKNIESITIFLALNLTIWKKPTCSTRIRKVASHNLICTKLFLIICNILNFFQFSLNTSSIKQIFPDVSKHKPFRHQRKQKLCNTILGKNCMERYIWLKYSTTATVFSV